MRRIRPQLLIRRSFCALAFFVYLMLSTSALIAGQLSPQQERGKSIYTRGESPDGEEQINAFFGPDNIPLPGSSAVCANCHGHDGTGRPESGLLPFNITWTYLTKKYGHQHENGLHHPPFTPESLKVYLKTGRYPEGSGYSDPGMPRYEMSDEDLNSLIAYLKRLGLEEETGISIESIRIGTLLPKSGPLVSIGQNISSTIVAAFSEVNNNGGIYGRKLVLEPIYLAANGTTGSQNLEQELDNLEVFALISPFVPHAETELVQQVNKLQLPLVGPLSLFPTSSFALNRHTFSLYPGLDEQMKVLLPYAANALSLERPKIAIIAPQDSRLDETLTGIRQTIREQGWSPAQKLILPGSAKSQIIQLQETGVDLVVYLGNEQQNRNFLFAADAAGWYPGVIGSGLLAGQVVTQFPDRFSDRIFLAYPTLPADRRKQSVTELRALLEKNQISASHPQVTISAYTASKILIKALRHAGRKLDRKQLIESLEQITNFNPGLTPQISFTRNRHTGVNGFHSLRFRYNPVTASRDWESVWLKVP